MRRKRKEKVTTERLEPFCPTCFARLTIVGFRDGKEIVGCECPLAVPPTHCWCRVAEPRIALVDGVCPKDDGRETLRKWKVIP